MEQTFLLSEASLGRTFTAHDHGHAVVLGVTTMGNRCKRRGRPHIREFVSYGVFGRQKLDHHGRRSLPLNLYMEPNLLTLAQEGIRNSPVSGVDRAVIIPEVC